MTLLNEHDVDWPNEDEGELFHHVSAGQWPEARRELQRRLDAGTVSDPALAEALLAA